MYTSDAHWRSQTLSVLLGNYSVYVYHGGAFDAISTDLRLPDMSKLGRHNHAVPVWVHRALLKDEHRTEDPATADIFFVPAYLSISKDHQGDELASHQNRTRDLQHALRNAQWYQRCGGCDHLFAGSEVSSGWANDAGYPEVAKVLSNGFIGAFEINRGWVGSNHWNHERIISIPYLVPGATSGGAFSPDNRTDVLFFVSDSRVNAVGWAGCNRSIMTKLDFLPGVTVDVVHKGQRRWPYREYKSREKMAVFCPAVCGDTPTSQRTFDIVTSGCVPLVVGTRLFGKCEPPCHTGWGWEVTGRSHLPFDGLWIDWSRFPALNESQLDSASSPDEASLSLKQALQPLHHRCQHSARKGSRSGQEAGLLGLDWARDPSVCWLRQYIQDTVPNLIYGEGDYRNSSSFGLVARRLVESAILRLRGTAMPPVPSFAPSCSPCEASE